jgi:hypothetical protein
MTIKRASTSRVEVDDATYLLLDDIALRLCAAWPLTPPDVRTSGLHDLASHLSRYANCTVNEAMTRLDLMLQAGILNLRGGVDDKVQARLRRAGALRMGLEDEEAVPDEPSGDEEDDGDD